MFPLRVPFWYRYFEPQPNGCGNQDSTRGAGSAGFGFHVSISQGLPHFGIPVFGIRHSPMGMALGRC